MSRTTHVSLTEAKVRLGELVKRSAYGGERFVLEFRGKPVAELKAWHEAEEDDGRLEVRGLGKLREASAAYETAEMRRERGLKAIEELRELRERIKKRHGGNLPDSVELIREMREERDNQILGLR